MRLNINTLVKKLERFLNIDASYIARGGFWLTLGKSVNAAMALVLSILYARFLLKETYGDYRYILSALNMLGIAALPGIGIALQRSVARGYDASFLEGSKMMFRASFVITAVGVTIGGYFFLTGSPTLALGFAVASLLVPFADGLGNWRGYFDGKRAFRTKTIYNLWSHVFYGALMTATVLGIYFFNLSPLWSLVCLIGAFLLSDAIPNILLSLKVARMIPRNATRETGGLRYGIHLSITNIPATVANYIDAILLHVFLGPAALAVYSFAIAPLDQLKSFFAIVEDVAYPKLSRKTTEAGFTAETRRLLPKIAFKSSLITGGIVLVYITAAPFLFQILFPKYIEAVPLSQFFALSLVFFPFGMFNVALKAEGNIKKIYAYNILAPIIQIASLAILIPLFGLWGAVAGRIIGRLVNLFIPLALFKW